MKHILLAKDLRAGDKVNSHHGGWLTVLQVCRNKNLPYGNITIYFTNGDRLVYGDCDSVDAIRF